MKRRCPELVWQVEFYSFSWRGELAVGDHTPQIDAKLTSPELDWNGLDSRRNRNSSEIRNFEDAATA